MARLDVELRDCHNAVDRLIGLHANMAALPPKYQKLVAEVVMLRLFDLFQYYLRRIGCKVACGATYLDGSTPTLVCRATSMASAEAAMKRSRNQQYLQWSTVAAIKRNVQGVIDANDHFVRVLDQHVQDIEEMRCVRNRIAHGHGNARRKYASVVRRYYGARVPRIAPGTLLLSERWQPSLLEVYLRSTKTLIRAIVLG